MSKEKEEKPSYEKDLSELTEQEKADLGDQVKEILEAPTDPRVKQLLDTLHALLNDVDVMKKLSKKILKE